MPRILPFLQTCNRGLFFRSDHNSRLEAPPIHRAQLLVFEVRLSHHLELVRLNKGFVSICPPERSFSECCTLCPHSCLCGRVMTGRAGDNESPSRLVDGMVPESATPPAPNSIQIYPDQREDFPRLCSQDLYKSHVPAKN